MRFRGFALVELVVVIAVITLLTGLSMPVLRFSRERARTVCCAGNVKQLLGGMMNYQIEYDAFPPGFRTFISKLASPEHYAGVAGAVDPAGRWWFDYSEEIDHATGDGVDLLICPSKRQNSPLLSLDVLCGNYGANLSLCKVKGYIPPYGSSFSGESLLSEQVLQPAETLLLVDSGYALISWWHATREPPVQLPPPSTSLGGVQQAAYVPGMGINADRMLLPGQSEDAIGGRHPNRTVNVGFADGSLASKKADALLVEKSAGRWNNSPLWQPDSDTVIPQTTTP